MQTGSKGENVEVNTDPSAFGRAYEEDSGLSEREWRRRLGGKGRRIYGAEIGGKLVGVARVKFESGKRIEHIATITSVLVDMRFRGRGIGTQLMTRIIADLYAASKIAKLRLSVNESRGPAKAMYKKLGFRQVGLTHKEIKVGKKYYDQSEMELIFKDKA